MQDELAKVIMIMTTPIFKPDDDIENNNNSATGIISKDGEDNNDDYNKDKDQDILDAEDMGKVIQSHTKTTTTSSSTKTPKAMVTPKQARALQKEGNCLIGIHSAVKLCQLMKHKLC
ncbi:hypothetical protein ACHAXS_005632 [Conticribra weissflogii]